MASIVATTPAAASAPASPPAITFDHACYQNNGPSANATFHADGLAPQSVLPVALDGQVIGQVTTDALGSLVASVPVPPHTTPDEDESTHELTLTPEGGPAISATFLTTAIAADFSPTRGDPLTMKVRFTAWGMNLVKRSSTVYLHYVAPSGKHRKTVSLGRAQGACGRLQSGTRKLFPFTPTIGKWTLQLDTSKAYHRGASRTRYPWARIGVAVPPPAPIMTPAG